MKKSIRLPEEEVISKIYLIRGQRVMLDSDLAELYDVETKVLNQAVRRNHLRFPKDFMFRLNRKEWLNLRSQIVTSSWGGRRALPLAFTEQGVAMLSSVLNSERAIYVNIQIIRVFTKMREILMSNKHILYKLEKIEKNMLKQGAHLKKHEEEIQFIFTTLKQLLQQPNPPRKRIGFKTKNEE